MSPERLLSEDYTFVFLLFSMGRYKCDYWSMALVIMEAALGYYPIQSSVSHVDVGMKCGYEEQLATSITQYGFDTFYRTNENGAINSQVN